MFYLLLKIGKSPFFFFMTYVFQNQVKLFEKDSNLSFYINPSISLLWEQLSTKKRFYSQQWSLRDIFLMTVIYNPVIGWLWLIGKACCQNTEVWRKPCTTCASTCALGQGTWPPGIVWMWVDVKVGCGSGYRCSLPPVCVFSVIKNVLVILKSTLEIQGILINTLRHVTLLFCFEQDVFIIIEIFSSLFLLVHLRKYNIAHYI